MTFQCTQIRSHKATNLWFQRAELNLPCPLTANLTKATVCWTWFASSGSVYRAFVGNLATAWRPLWLSSGCAWKLSVAVGESRSPRLTAPTSSICFTASAGSSPISRTGFWKTHSFRRRSSMQKSRKLLCLTAKGYLHTASGYHLVCILLCPGKEHLLLRKHKKILQKQKSIQICIIVYIYCF